jgi:hypothetical protein
VVSEAKPGSLTCLPITIKVDCKISKAGRHELALAHRTGPGAAHGVKGGVPLLEDEEAVDQLLPEVLCSGWLQKGFAEPTILASTESSKVIRGFPQSFP